MVKSTLVISFLVAFLLLSCKNGNDPRPKNAPSTVKVIDGIRIAWDYRSMHMIAPVSSDMPGYFGYPRMKELHDGRLACVYETSRGNIELIISDNEGETWTSPQVIFTTERNIPPFVPEIIELFDHSVLVACNPRPQPPYTEDRNFGIKIRKSIDGCKTWQDEQLLYEAQHTFNNGCWEPSFVQLPSGEVQLFFSNEGVYETSNEQNISILSSLDNGETWTKNPKIVSFRKDKRDGMPVPLLLEDRGELIFSVEDNYIDEFKPTIIREKITDNWSTGYVSGDDTRRNYHPLNPRLTKNTYAGAPYIVRLESGEVLLSYQSTLNRSANWEHANMIVEIGDDAGTTFNRRSVPFNMPNEKLALWNSLSVINGNTPVALAATNMNSDVATQVYMVKGHVIPEYEIVSGKAIIDGKIDDACWNNEWPYFVGHTSDTQLEANICVDDEYLYFVAKVNDDDIVSNAGRGAYDGVTLQIDTERIGYVAPHKNIFAFNIIPDGTLKVSEGNSSQWEEIEDTSIIQLKSKNDDDGYVIEMAIPLVFFNNTIASQSNVGINIILRNTLNNNRYYEESITSNNASKPFSWCPAKITPHK